MQEGQREGRGVDGPVRWMGEKGEGESWLGWLSYEVGRVACWAHEGRRKSWARGWLKRAGREERKMTWPRREGMLSQLCQRF